MKSITQSLFLLTIILLLKPSTSLTEEQTAARQNLISNFQYLGDTFKDHLSHQFPNYYITTADFNELNPNSMESSTLSNKYIFENNNAREHMFNMTVVLGIKANTYSITFDHMKTNSVQVRLGLFDMNEAQYQLASYTAFLRQSIRFDPFWKKSFIHLTTIEDLKNGIKSEAGVAKELQFIPSFNSIYDLPDNTLKYYIKSKESYIGTFSCYLEQEGEQKNLADIHLEENYLLNFAFRIYKDRISMNGGLKVPVLDVNNKNVKAQIKLAVNAIDFKDQINNMDDLVVLLKAYFGRSSNKFQITEISKSDEYSETFFKYFDVELENSKMTMYLGTAFSDDTTDYVMMMDYPGNNFYEPIINASFKRTGKDALFKLLDYYQVNTFFKTIFEDIMDLFKGEYEQFKYSMSQNEEISTVEELTHYDDETKLMGDKDKGVKTSDIKCSYLEMDSQDGKKITVRMTSVRKDLDYKETFLLKNYNKNELKSTMDMFFRKLQNRRMIL